MKKIILRGQDANLILTQTGRVGPQGPQGETGEGVPIGGTAGQVLTKQSNADYDTDWDTPPAAPVTSVNGKTGVVVLDKADIGLGNVDNTSDADKPISTATQLALDDKADSTDLDDYVLKAGDTMTGTLIQETTGLANVQLLYRDGVEVGGIDTFAVYGGGFRIRASTGTLQLAGTGELGILVRGDSIDMQNVLNIQSVTTATRPTNNIQAGSNVFDTDLGSPIWYDGTDWVEMADADDVVTLSGNQTISDTKTFSSPIRTPGAIMHSNLFQPLELSRFSDNASAQGFRYIKARGSIGSPAGVQSGDQIARFMATGYINDGTLPTVGDHEDFITVDATEAWTSTARGRQVTISSVPNGTTGRVPGLIVQPNGDVRVPNTITLGPNTDTFQTVLTVRRNNMDTGRIDNNASGMRVQAINNSLFLRNPSNVGIIIGASTITFESGISAQFNNESMGFFNATPVTQRPHIVDADGTLEDITTKFNTLLLNLEQLGFLAPS